MAGERHTVIIGGGAAGFFAAIASRSVDRLGRVTILERGAEVLSKVRISGGGRCNVTHDQPDPAQLVRFYPRGARALRGPFTRFGPRETVAWFAQHGVELKAEADGRMFPVTDDSATVIDCLLRTAVEAGVDVRTRAAVTGLEREQNGTFTVSLRDGSQLQADRVLLATGGAPGPWQWAEELGHAIEPPVPSIFTFNITDDRLTELPGVSVPVARVRLDGAKDWQEGPLLVTHWGLSGPAVLRASAWGARLLHENGYRLGLTVNWLPELTAEELRSQFNSQRKSAGRKTVLASGPDGLPGRLWRSLAAAAGAAEGQRWADVPNSLIAALVNQVNAGRFDITGKGVFKEEFVTCGGVRLKEVDFRTMESRLVPGLYFAGEVLDIDGITGGFNFQSAWTTGWLAGRALARVDNLTPTDGG